MHHKPTDVVEINVDSDPVSMSQGCIKIFHLNTRKSLVFTVPGTWYRCTVRVGDSNEIKNVKVGHGCNLKFFQTDF